MPSLKEKMKDMSFIEKKREKDRQVADVMDQSADENDPDLEEAQKVLPQWYLKWSQFMIVFVYGLICVLAIFALCCYLLDMAVSTFGGDFGDYIDYILLSVVFFTIIGSVLGCCLTFKYGTVSSNIQRLQQQTHLLRDKVDGFTEVQQLLQDEVSTLKTTLYGINVEKNSLLKCVDKFDKLSNNLQGANGVQDEFVGECDAMCDDLWTQYETIKLQTEKADLLKLFYDKQALDDNEQGLNRQEFDYLLFDLDENISGRFPPFDEFDENGNGVIEIFEFETVLDAIYEQILEERKDKTQRKIDDHYRNRNQQNQINDNVRDERRNAIDREKQNEKNMKLSTMFKMFK